jgi:DNA-binding LacI/PurR family transcriptional regulator
MSKITIEDISRHTGLSRGTVSRALNNRPDISVQTKQRVLEACRELNYVPSHAARSLATGRCYAVAVAVDDLHGAFAASFVRGVLTSAKDEHYAVYVSELGEDMSTSIDHLATVAHERVDSVLLATPVPSDLGRRLIDALDKRPLVTFGGVEGVTTDAFSPDYAEAGRLVGRFALRGGTADVAYVHTPGPSYDEALNGFREVCTEYGIAPEQATVHVHGTDSDRYGTIRNRISNLRAVIASDDYTALDLMCLCRELGRVPGRDIAIIGQGNESVGTRVTPTLTTVDYSAEEIGRRAMDIALQRVLRTRQDAPTHTLVAPQLITRNSTQTL